MNVIRVHRIWRIVDPVFARCRNSIVTTRHDFNMIGIAPDILLSSCLLQGFLLFCGNLSSDAFSLIPRLNSPSLFSAIIQIRKKIEDDRNRKSGQRTEKQTDDRFEPVVCVPAGKQF